MMNRVLLHPDYFQHHQPASTVSPEFQIKFTRIAEYSLKPDREFEITFFSPGMARGTYKINYERLRQLKAEGLLDPKERKMVQETIRYLEMINARRNLIYRIIHSLPDWQREFFDSEDWDLLRPLTQKKASDELHVTPAAVCRAIQSRSVVLNTKVEVPLADLFPSSKDIQKRQIARIFKEHPKEPDKRIQALVRKDLNIALSRRSINVYRREIMGKRQRSTSPENPQ